MSAHTTPQLTDAVEQVLRANGLTDQPGTYDSDIHSWRCSHPDIYGPCGCFQELRDELADLLAARGGDTAGTLRARIWAAMEDAMVGRLNEPGDWKRGARTIRLAVKRVLESDAAPAPTDNQPTEDTHDDLAARVLALADEWDVLGSDSLTGSRIIREHVADLRAVVDGPTNTRQEA